MSKKKKTQPVDEHQHPEPSITNSPTSEQMDNGISQAEGDWLGAGDPGAPAGHVLRRDAEQTTRLPGEHVLAVAQEWITAAVERDVVRVTGGHANAGAGQLAAVPAPFLTHTAGSDGDCLR